MTGNNALGKKPADMRVVDLKEELKKRGLPVAGKKAELVERLEAALSEESNADVEKSEEPSDKDQSAIDEPASEEQAAPAQETQVPEAKSDLMPISSPTREQELPTSERVQESATTTTSALSATPTLTDTSLTPPSTQKDATVDDEGPLKRKRQDEASSPIVDKRTKADSGTETKVSPVQGTVAETQNKGEEMVEAAKDAGIQGAAIYVKGFVRPLIVRHVDELVQRYGTVKQFWMDSIKTHCYVIYASEEEAQAAQSGIDGIVFPPDTGRKLTVGGLTPEQATSLIEQEQAASDKRVRVDWEAALAAIERGEDPSPKVWSDRDAKATSTASPAAPAIASTSERAPIAQPPSKSLDELFHKTNTLPHLYFMPVPEEQALSRLESLQGRHVR